jgi:hypothetical protein
MTALGSAAAWVFRDHLAQGLAAMLRRERDHRRRAAERGRHGRAVEIVGAHEPGRGFLLDMAMAVDRAGQHNLAGRVDVAVAGRQALAERDDRAIPDADVADGRVGGGCDRAVADHQIEFGHVRPFPLSRHCEPRRGEAISLGRHDADGDCFASRAMTRKGLPFAV